MPNFAVHASGGNFVIDADIESLAALANVASQAHRPHVARADLPEWLQDLGETFGRIFENLPRRPTYTNLQAMIDAQELQHVGFISYSARVVLGVDHLIAQSLADCLELALADAYDPEFETITGADLAMVRAMYLTVSAALGSYGEAHRRAFPDRT